MVATFRQVVPFLFEHSTDRRARLSVHDQLLPTNSPEIMRQSSRDFSRQQFMDHMAMDIRKAAVDAVVP